MEHVVSVQNIAALKSQPGNGENIVMTLGQTTKGDSLGALYFYDSTDSTTIEDSIFYNTVIPANNIGRWKKVITRTLVLPHGTLFMNGGKRDFFCASTTIADGTCTINLTMDNTANGLPIFSQVFFDDSKANVEVTSINDSVGSCRKTLSANNKQLTHIFYRGNALTLNLGIVTAGLTSSGLRTAATGTSVLFSVSGR